MAYTLNPTPKTEESKRLYTVLLEYGGSLTSFAKYLDVSKANLSRMINGQTPITMDVTKTVCFKMGYSANWFIAGVGHKRKDIDKSSSMVTDIAKYKTDLEITQALIFKQKERINFLESQMEQILKTVEELKQSV